MATWDCPFSLFSFSFALKVAHCTRFFEYIGFVTPRSGILYSVFRIHSGRLSSQWHIVFGFSHTFGLLPLAAAHCIRFFAYIRVAYPSQRHNVFGFSHTFGSFTLAVAHCIRFFAYIRVACPRSGTLYSVFRIHLVRYPSHWHNVFGFSHTFSSFTLAVA
jgi:hypothetical protein